MIFWHSLKLRSESEHQYNSPWNIVAKFNIDMSFSFSQIKGMLEECELVHHTGMNMESVSEEIYNYTSGYPVLISSICKYIDEDILGEDNIEIPVKVWSKEGIENAVKQILIDNVPLFENMIRHLNEYPKMNKMFQGSEFSYSTDTKEIGLGVCLDML